MKKYPITYKGKEYEVRWEERLAGDVICIYEIYKVKILNIKYYKQVYFENENNLMNWLSNIGISKKDSNYYIEEVKYLFELMELSIKRHEKANKEKYMMEKALAEWDGVIN